MFLQADRLSRFVQINSGDALAPIVCSALQDERRVKVELMDLGKIR
jgi:hypothetical protein